ncbi:DUF995 domain-containing protein [Rhizobium leguminosarum]|uniref:DUF995 domain-containing protein n=1 Tax=Rhizobium leguminosarum TaxID=384 RepID=UPI0015DAC54F|nr:DUF995 domain-containing protein [Rhizobium leguminosarum]NZD49165.1 DUF995 domain-containing protein [Rhizobium leguminosarum]
MSMLQKMFLAVALTSGIATAASASGTNEPAGIETAKPMSSAEIYRLYNQNSWMWKAGAGYFSAKARRFTAWSRENGSPSFGTGRWFITESGKLCFNADWHAKTGTATAITCFSHRKKGGLIYQKREPDGQWYVFKSAPAQATDEFAKLRRGDYVRSQLGGIEMSVSKTR